MSAPLLELRDLRVVLPCARGPAARCAACPSRWRAARSSARSARAAAASRSPALAIMGLLPKGARVGDSIRLNGDGAGGPADERDGALRGDRVAMIFQEPMTALNPLHTVGAQVAEPLRLHRGLDRGGARRGAAPARIACSCRMRRNGSTPTRTSSRRAAPARDDRHGAGLRARSADRRRADHGARS